GKKGGDPDDPDDPLDPGKGGGGLFRPIAFFPAGQPDPKKADQKKDDPKKGDPKKDDPKKGDQKKDDPKKDEPKKDDPQKKGGGKGGGGGIKPGGNDNRWNWSTPMLLSPHDPKVFYCGSQYLYMSTDRGNNPKAISPDLTYGGGGGGKGGGGAHSLFTIGESPKKKGVLWTGSDDGRIMVSKDTGKNWSDVSKIPGLPKDRCISRVEPSHYDEGTCYVSITRYRNDDRKPYIFKTTNYGETWENVTNNLPVDGSVNVVIESSANPNLLFCGTEFGLFASLDGAKSWHRMKGGMPTVAVHDLVIHPRDRDLVVGTHGRSIFVFDDISPLEQQTANALAKQAHLFEVRPAVAFKWKKTGPDPKSNEFTGTNPQYGAFIRYHLRNQTNQDVTISIHNAAGKELASIKGTGNAGLNQVVWNLQADGVKDATVEPGEYLVVLSTGSFREGQKVIVEAEQPLKK
ncbi:MAG TPA: T9SS type A sorting domain-containing protein, partial [Gemmataceae bacterium]|nr:T9SS type A sorting domain-containing protein [Gemmataceae bacterium]